jgi:hypothetical protein
MMRSSAPISDAEKWRDGDAANKQTHSEEKSSPRIAVSGA